MKVFALTGLALAALSIPVIVIYSKPAPHPVLAASTSCDPAVAWTSPDGRDGAAVFVKVNGPDVVTIDVNGVSKNDHRHLQQQVTKRGGGAVFDFADLDMFNNDPIRVSTRGWSCTVSLPRSAL